MALSGLLLAVLISSPQGQTSVPRPTRENPNEFWSQDHGNKKPLELKHCRDTYGSLTRIDLSEHLIRECEPDTLYSWGPMEKIAWLKTWASGSNWGKINHPLFLARSPIATFGYGEIPIRVKLKQGVRFEAFSYEEMEKPEWKDSIKSVCEIKSDAIKNTVFFRLGYLSDWIICSADVIHSWSYGTKENYDEMIADYRQHLAGKSVDNYVNFAGVDTLFMLSPDNKSFKEKSLVQKLANIVDMIDQGKSEIVFNPSLPMAEATPQSHFSTDHPIYFDRK